jgi:hypothetical protein
LAAISCTAWAQSSGDARERSGNASTCGPAGYVHAVSGVTTVQRGSIKPAPARIGDLFEANAVFRNGPNDKVTLKFADGQVVVLGADSALRIVRYCYVPNNLRLSTSTIELMRGEMRFATGIIGATYREGIHVGAGNALVSIQSPGGADFTVLVSPDRQEAGAVAVAHGKVSVRTQQGPNYTVEAGQYVPWLAGRTPAAALPVAAAPAVIQAAVSDLWATVVPASNPVAVAPAARTAVVVAAAGVASGGMNSDPKPAGYVAALTNSADIQAAGKTITTRVGTTIEAGATFNTGNDGRAVLKFADGQLVILGPGSALRIEQYQFDPCDPGSSKSTINLTEGAMRYVSGNIHAENSEAVRITAGASTISMPSAAPADFTVAVNTRGQEVGVARVALGEISVRTPYGTINRVATDQSNTWGPRKTPASPVPMEQEQGVVQAAVKLQQSGLPDNTPVAVSAAARAAAALAAASRAEAAANADPANARLQEAAQEAGEQATMAIQAANAASQAVAVTALACTLQELPATAAGPAPAALAAAPPLPSPPALTLPPVTPGAGGGCTGSKC